MDINSILNIVVMGIVFLIFIIIFFYVVGIYNRLVTLRNGWEATFNQVLVTLKKRLDMITQLVEAVRSYTKFEKDLFVEVTRLRSSAMEAKTPDDVNKIEGGLRSIMRDIKIAVEAYPNPQAVGLVSNLMSSVSEIEDEAARYRYTYNNIVQEFNTICDIFPSNIVASILGFKKTEYLQVEREEVEKRPEITF
ncbi:MAG: LemA family protein [Brevinematia bacterium]